MARNPSSPRSAEKKRPTPIKVPRLDQHRAVPGPNTFATLAAQARQQGLERQLEAGNAFYQQAKRSANATPVTSPVPTNEPQLPRTGSQTSKGRGTAMTTLSSITDQARGSVSPRKSGQSSTTNTSAVAAHQALLDQDVKTSRGEIEGRAERKFHQMMRQIPQTPTGSMFLPHPHRFQPLANTH